MDFYPQSQFNLDHRKNNYFGWVTFIINGRYAITDENGEAEFDNLTVWDITGNNATWKFYFVVGDRHEGIYKRSNLTSNSYTFVPSSKFEIVTQPSNYISPLIDFISPLKIRVTSKIPRKFYFLNIQLAELFNIKIKDTPFNDYTIRFLNNALCYLYNDGLVWKNYTDCNWWKTVSKIPGTEQLEIEFQNLQWAVYGTQSNFKMSIASLLQHNTVNEALTQSISIENIANSINFISDPPSEVFINQIFNVNLAVKIVGGSPLSSTDISWNVTKEFDLTKITTEIFTSLGNTNYNIQKTSLLAPSSKLDDDRTTDKTDENGIAKVYLRIKESPLNSKVVIVCQCGNVVSPPSSVISVLHSIRQITYNENYEETVKVEFSKNENEYLSK